MHLIDNWRPQFLLSSSKFDDHQRLFSPPVRISRWFFSWCTHEECTVFPNLIWIRRSKT